MTKLATATVEILGDDSNLQRALKDAQAQTAATGGKLSRLTDGAKKQFGGLAKSAITLSGAMKVLGGATAIGFAAQKIFDLGADVVETASKFETVLGPSVGQAQAFLNEFANTAGLTNREGQELLATTAAIAQGMGFSQKASGSFAQEVVKLAGDLTSFNNIPIDETSLAIQSALTGERESLKRLGIVIMETDVQQRALLNTGKATADALTQQEKATATLQLITERAGVAVGDLGRTMMSPSNQARALRAKILTLVDSMAQSLLPAAGVVLQELGKDVGGFEEFGQTLTENSQIIAAWAKFTVEAIKTVALAIAAPIRIAFNLGQTIGNVLVAAFQALTGNLAGAKSTLGDLGHDFDDITSSIDLVITGFQNMQVASGLAWTAMAQGDEPLQQATQSADALASAVHDVTGELSAVPGKTTPTISLGAKFTDVFGQMVQRGRENAAAVAQMTENFELAGGTLDRVTPKAVKTADAMAGLGRQTMTAGDIWHDFGRGVGFVASAGTDAIVDFAFGAKNAIRSFVSDALRQLARLAANALFKVALNALFPGAGAGGGFLSGLFGGFFATGGLLPAGHFGVVGEKGPELVFAGPSGATIQPMTSGAGRSMASAPAPNPAAFADAVLSRVGPPPSYASPEVAANDAYWRRFVTTALTDAKRRGVI